MYDAICQIETSLLPLQYIDWKLWHEWPYQQISKKIDDDIVIDVGSGCGLLGIYLIYHKFAERALLFEGRKDQADFTVKLCKFLGIDNKVIVSDWYTGGSKHTHVSCRFGNLKYLEDLSRDSKCVTLGRLNDCEPYFVRPNTDKWSKEIVTRPDGFELELLYK